MSAPGNFADYEVLVPDERLLPIRGRLLLAFPALPRDVELATCVQPAGETENGFQPELALFLLISPHPKRPESKLISHAYTLLTDWREAEQERSHFAGRKDPLVGIYMMLGRKHAEAVSSLRELIN